MIMNIMHTCVSGEGVKSMYKQDMIYMHIYTIICLLLSLPEEALLKA